MYFTSLVWVAIVYPVIAVVARENGPDYDEIQEIEDTVLFKILNDYGVTPGEGIFNEVELQNLMESRKKDIFGSLWSIFQQPNDIVYSFQAYNLAASLACYQNLPKWKSIFTVLKMAKKYLTYGCYCGQEGAGTPVDSIDRCCKAHDLCFNKVYYRVPLWLRGRQIHFTRYRAQCHTVSTNNRDFICKNKPGTTSRKLCDCDNVFGRCIRQHDPDFKKWNPKHDCIRGTGINHKCGRHTVTKTKNSQCPLPNFVAMVLGKIKK